MQSKNQVVGGSCGRFMYVHKTPPLLELHMLNVATGSSEISFLHQNNLENFLKIQLLDSYIFDFSE